jgi:hypothetical protein
MTPAAQIDQLIASLTDWRGKTFAAVRKAVLAADPKIVEAWKWMGSPVWERDGMIAVCDAHKGKVKLTFAHGAHLADPDHLFNAGFEGNARRIIDFLEGDKINAPALTALVRAAIVHNQTKLKKNAKAKAAPKADAKTKPAKSPKAAKPTLLSGGNPQIAKADGEAPVQAYIDAMPGWKRDLGTRLDALIVRTVPNVQKAVKWNSPMYGIEGRGWFLSFHVFTRYVKVAFFQGASLRPLPPGTSKGKDTRYLDIHEGDALDEAQLADWVKQAAKLPGFLGEGR